MKTLKIPIICRFNLVDMLNSVEAAQLSVNSHPTHITDFNSGRALLPAQSTGRHRSVPRPRALISRLRGLTVPTPRWTEYGPHPSTLKFSGRWRPGGRQARGALRGSEGGQPAASAALPAQRGEQHRPQKFFISGPIRVKFGTRAGGDPGLLPSEFQPDRSTFNFSEHATPGKALTKRATRDGSSPPA